MPQLLSKDELDHHDGPGGRSPQIPSKLLLSSDWVESDLAKKIHLVLEHNLPNFDPGTLAPFDPIYACPQNGNLKQ